MINLFKRNKSKSKSNVTVIDVAKELLTHKRLAYKWVKDNVQNIARYLLAMIDVALNINHIPAVVHLRQFFQSKTNEIGVIFSKNLSEYRTIYNKYEKSFGNNAPNAEADKQKSIDDLSSERTKFLDGASDGHTKDMSDTEKTIGTLEQEVNDKKNKLKTLPKHNLRPRKISSGIVIGFLVLAEIYMNRDAYEYAGFYDPASTLIGLGIAIGTYAVGMGLATIWRSQKYQKMAKIASSVVLTLLVATVYFALGMIRVSQLTLEETEGTFILSPVYFMTMNLVLFVGIFLSKLLLYPSPQKIADNEAYDGAKKDLKESEKALANHKKRFFNGYQVEHKKREQVNKQFDAKIKPFQAAIKGENETFRKAALNFNTELAQARNFYAQINADYKSSVALLFNTIPQYTDGKAILLDMNTL
ncbi:MAG: hypothetical protein GKR88_15375 [Flavobacteriaceae bacterium]|nr:MAG: hypothetical protein GKR88_15375 [Flavobacteriaceae bacterium]